MIITDRIKNEVKEVKPLFLKILKQNTKNGDLYTYKNYAYKLRTEVFVLKKVVKELITEGQPIISKKVDNIIGLILCQTDEDYQSYVTNMRYKISRIEEKINNLKKAYKGVVNV